MYKHAYCIYTNVIKVFICETLKLSIINWDLYKLIKTICIIFLNLIRSLYILNFNYSNTAASCPILSFKRNNCKYPCFAYMTVVHLWWPSRNVWRTKSKGGYCSREESFNADRHKRIWWHTIHKLNGGTLN